MIKKNDIEKVIVDLKRRKKIFAQGKCKNTMVIHFEEKKYMKLNFQFAGEHFQLIKQIEELEFLLKNGKENLNCDLKEIFKEINTNIILSYIVGNPGKN